MKLRQFDIPSAVNLSLLLFKVNSSFTKIYIKMSALPPPLLNPVVPCILYLSEGMYAGLIISIKGCVLEAAESFSINLQCGPKRKPRSDLGFQLNFRFEEERVVRNHCIGGEWGQEETEGGMPLAKGDDFEAVVECESTGYKVSLNGEHFCEFLHRVPYQQAAFITVEGDVSVDIIAFEGQMPPDEATGDTPSR